MSEAFLGEVRMWGLNFAPKDWAFCDGAVIQASANPALYATIGNHFGGTAPTTYMLPDLRGRTPVCMDQTISLGAADGVESVVLTTTNLPHHSHLMTAMQIDATSPFANGMAFAQPRTGSGAKNLYGDVPQESEEAPFASSAVGTAGASQAHNNMQPSIVLNFCICITGIFPPRN